MTKSEAILSENREARESVTKVTLTSDKRFTAKIDQFMIQNFILKGVRV